MPGGPDVRDGNGQSLAYVYSRENPSDVAKLLTEDEARRIAANIAKLPDQLRSKAGCFVHRVTKFFQEPISHQL